jgi:hypothetical protein
MNQRPEIRINLRLYADSDPDLYQWASQLNASHHGEKTATIKDVLRNGLGKGEHPATTLGLTALNLDSLADTLLAQIRPVVEAAVTSALQRLQLSAAPVTEAVDATTEEDAFADLLFANLTLEEC